MIQPQTPPNVYTRKIVRRAHEKEVMLHFSLNALSAPILVAERSGRVVFANAASDILLQANPFIKIANGRLKAKLPQDHAPLRKLLYRLEPNTITGILLGHPAEDFLSLVAMPFPKDSARSFDPSGEIFLEIITLHSSSRSWEVNAHILEPLFGLSPAEVSLAQAITQGISIKNYSCLQNISTNTSRTHLKSIFSKTGTSRQSDLLRLLLGLSLINRA